MVRFFHWGWVHCIDRITRPEESILLFSNDMIKKFLDQNPKVMQCHSLADQMTGLWSNDLGIIHLFRHDSGIHHTPIVSEEPSLRTLPNICQSYMAIHGTYPNDMRNFGKIRGHVF